MSRPKSRIRSVNNIKAMIQNKQAVFYLAHLSLFAFISTLYAYTDPGPHTMTSVRLDSQCSKSVFITCTWSV
jgi:hypothetical protein